MNFNKEREGAKCLFSSPWEKEEYSIKRDASMVCVTMVLVFFLSSFMHIILMGLGRAVNPDLAVSDFYKELTAFISYMVSLLVPFSLFGAYTGVPVEKALQTRKTPPHLLICALILSLGVSVVGIYASAIIKSLLSYFGIVFETSFSSVPKGPLAMSIYFINLTAVPAFLEEMAFRGFLMQSLRKYGDGFALFSQALCFALLHVTPDRYAHTFIMGLVIGYFVLFTGSLKTGIIIHFTYNFIVTCFSLFAGSERLTSDMLMVVSHVLILILSFIAFISLLRRYRNIFKLRKGMEVRPARINIRTFCLSKGMILFYVFIFIMALRRAVRL